MTEQEAKHCSCGCGESDKADDFFTCIECDTEDLHPAHMYYCVTCDKHMCGDCMSEEHDHVTPQENQPSTE